jgi:hypothetical protein
VFSTFEAIWVHLRYGPVTRSSFGWQMPDSGFVIFGICESFDLTRLV